MSSEYERYEACVVNVSRKLLIDKQLLQQKSRFWHWFGVPRRAKYKIFHKNFNKNLHDLKLIFLEPAYVGPYSGQVWENRIFLSCIPSVDPYSKPLLNSNNGMLLNPQNWHKKMQGSKLRRTYIKLCIACCPIFLVSLASVYSVVTQWLRGTFDTFYLH